jgi:hypothetical protein
MFHQVKEYKYWTVTVKSESADENVITKFHSLFGIIIRGKRTSPFFFQAIAGMQLPPL